MKRYLSVMILGLSIIALAEANVGLRSLANQSGISSRIKSEKCDTVIDVDGYKVKVIKEKGEFSHIGLNLFSPEMKKVTDKGLLNFIETSLFAKSRQTESGNSELLTITGGRIKDFKDLSPDSDCNVSNINSRIMTAAWNLNGQEVSVSIPTHYDVTKTGTRSEIEQDFIAMVKEGGLKRASFDEINKDYLEPYAEDMYILPGGSYINRNINRNVYFSDIEQLNPAWGAEHPLESLANLVLYPSDFYSDPKVDVTVVRHEYGEKETFTAPLSQLLAAAEAEGCVPFWGVEKYKDGILEGSIFIYNRQQGYDHVVKIECDPKAVVNGEGKVKAKCSLFIPTNNVRDMFAPYIKKTEEEKIKYGKK